MVVKASCSVILSCVGPALPHLSRRKQYTSSIYLSQQWAPTILLAALKGTLLSLSQPSFLPRKAKCTTLITTLVNLYAPGNTSPTNDTLICLSMRMLHQYVSACGWYIDMSQHVDVTLICLSMRMIHWYVSACGCYIDMSQHAVVTLICLSMRMIHWHVSACGCYIDMSQHADDTLICLSMWMLHWYVSVCGWYIDTSHHADDTFIYIYLFKQKW